MTAKTRSALNRIVLIFIAAGMILGLVHSAVCNESYDTVRGFSEDQNEMSTPVLPALPDIIADTSANTNLTGFPAERGRQERQTLAGFDNAGWADFRNCRVLSVSFYILLLCVPPGTYFKHIFYIHLKDGNK